MLKIFLVFFISQIPYPALPKVKTETSEWIPYSFKGSEFFKYEVRGVEDKETKTGYEIIQISKSGEKYKIKIEGKYGESEGSFTTTVENKDDIAGAIISQSIFNPYLAPLAAALFSPAWAYYFGVIGISTEEGSYWKQKDQSGNLTEVEVKGSETYAGKKGKKMIVKENGKEVWVIVWAEDVALPLYIRMGKKDEGFYELKLVEYKD
ncbi:MAG: hypothetical protein ABIM78_00010 [candidate division WOR-3 bacterium]